MTLAEYVQDYCFQRGMPEDQAKVVVQLVKTNPINEPLVGRWSHQIGEYPLSMIALLTVAINKIALKYLNEVSPDAWYKEMFQS